MNTAEGVPSQGGNSKVDPMVPEYGLLAMVYGLCSIYRILGLY